MSSSKKRTMITVVVPVYNEAGCLGTNVSLLDDHMKALNFAYELILVDDGSTDSTKAICHDIAKEKSHVRLITYPVNRGKGYAVRTGILEANGQYVIFTDADLAVPARFVGECLGVLEAGLPVVVGSRHLPESCFKVPEDPLRRFLGEGFRRFAQFSLGLRVSDITCGLKGFEKTAAIEIFSRSKIDRWGYDAETMFLAQKLGYTIEEIPVDWYHSSDSAVRVGVDLVRTLVEIFQVHYFYLSKQYKCLAA